MTKLIPVLTTQSGSCLTAKNWQEAGVTRVSYELSSLLFKPGLDYLKTLPSMDAYFPWKGEWVLNASTLSPNAEGVYVLRSTSDGSRVTCSREDIVALILQLKPQYAILPKGFHHVGDDVYCQLSETTRLFAPAIDVAQYSRQTVQGLYYEGDVIEEIRRYQLDYPQAQHYVANITDLSLIRLIYDLGVQYIESDYLASEASAGRVLSSDDWIDLKNPDYAMQFEVVDSGCSCPTCMQNLTRAYLHHLLEHTPLLCQRMLIQHNVGFVA